jgi:hypothetical protein
MANITDLYAQGNKVISTDSAAGSSQTDSATSLADYLIVTPSGSGNSAIPGEALLYGIDGQNTSATEKWLFVFDFASSAALAIPANGSTPIAGAKLIHVLDLPPVTTNKGQFGYQGITAGEGFLSGICLVVSTTGPGTLTVDTAKTTFMCCQYGATFAGY